MLRKTQVRTRALRRDRRAVLMLALPLAVLVLIVPLAAQAQPGHAADGALLSGPIHSLGGFDHLVAMVAEGLAGGMREPFSGSGGGR